MKIEQTERSETSAYKIQTPGNYPEETILHKAEFLNCIRIFVTHPRNIKVFVFNSLNTELNPICCLLALLGAHHFLHVSRIRVKSLTLRLLMS